MDDLKIVMEELDRLNNDSHISDCKKGSLPEMKEVMSIIMGTLSVMFPGFFSTEKEFSLDDIMSLLSDQIEKACRFSEYEPEFTASEAAGLFIRALPGIKRLLLTDIEALFEGDPAAKSREEVLICYPGFMAIAVYRMAHILYVNKIPLIPRMMTEFAHGRTGVDIHAGAQIGEYFFIDHATGIVIGETTVIGNHVKLYQGVTLGAKSFETDASGNPVKDIKRHPNIGNHVVIYANATILGGSTYIGDNSIIGANTWVIESVPSGSRIYYSAGLANAEQFWGDNGSGI